MLRLLIFVAVFALVVYAVFRALAKRDTPPQQSLPRGPMGPDDDEDFLRELEWRRHRPHRDEEATGGTPEAAPDTTDTPESPGDDKPAG